MLTGEMLKGYNKDRESNHAQDQLCPTCIPLGGMWAQTKVLCSPV